MSNDLQIFKNEEFGAVRVVDQNGEPWFIAKDVAEILGYSDTAKMYRRLDKDEKSKIKSADLAFLNQTNDLVIINESGLYNAVLGSQKEEAKKFKKWITSEVIPSIRKTGGYNTLTPFEIPKNENEWIDCTLQLLGKYKTAVEKNAVLVEKVDDLSTKLGDNENWKRVSAIPWLKTYFDIKKVPGVYQAIGKELSRMTRYMGIEKKYAKSFHYANAIGVYHIDVIDKLEEELKADGALLREYRRLRRRRNRKTQLRLVSGM